MDWGAIEPAILGTLFERGLNPDMRSQLGAHYTDPATILKLIRPVIERRCWPNGKRPSRKSERWLDKYASAARKALPRTTERERLLTIPPAPKTPLAC